MRFKGSEKPLPEIARELDVDAVVEGSALLVGDRVRITAQLIEGASDQHLWSESYERPMADILRLQTEVARAIAGGIKATLTPQDKRRLSSARLVDPEAHQLYLKGRFHWNKKTQEGFDKSIEYYKQALEIDSESALSYAGLAATYADLANWGRLPMIEVVPKAKAAALTALEIDPTLGEAHRVLAQIAFLEWDWSVAGDEIEKAIELNPNDASAHHLYSFLLTGWRPEEAIQEGQRAQELDPLSTPISVDLGRVYYWARDYDQAIEEYRNVLELSPDDLYAQWALGVSLAQKGRYEEAIATFMGREVPTAHINYALGWAYGLAGRREEATQVLEALLERSEEGFVPPGQIAYVHLGLGDEDKVFEWLEKAYKIRDPWVIELRWNPAFDSVRDDPRSKDILRRMNLPE
jgi:tetratricopeptide (TPR) repeat protein